MRFTVERMTREDAPNSTSWRHGYHYRTAAAQAAGRDKGNGHPCGRGAGCLGGATACAKIR